ncbi:MAG TPA: glycosyltransferase [Roseiflexaceae bacterium]|nr:glycosyltransferase [Roseiflexaceae bacterium]
MTVAPKRPVAVSVVVPTVDSPLIGQVVAALQRQTAQAAIGEIIVVGPRRRPDLPAGVRFLETARPLSAAAARNHGAAAARGSFLLFIDDDCLAAPDLVEHMLQARRAGYAVVGGSVTIEPGAYWRLCDNLLSFAGFLSSEPAGPRVYLPSLNFGIERALFEQVGGFDTRFPGAAGEDAELGLRLRERGVELFFEPRATVLHRPARASSGAVWRHLQNFGRATVTVRRDYAALAPRLNARLRPLSGAIRAAAPLMALWDVLGMLRTFPPLRQHCHALPGVLWARVAWYWGVADGLLVSKTL